MDGYRCVPFYGCTNGEIITSGKNVIDTRSFSVALDPQTSICPGDLEVCCRHPDWRDVPLTIQVVIKHPPPECKSVLGKVIYKGVLKTAQVGFTSELEFRWTTVQ